MSQNPDHLIWIDLEMTGLDPDNDRIIELAIIITDKELDIIAEGPEIAVYQPRQVMNLMDDWNVKQHTQSGLKKRVEESEIDEKEAEKLALEFIKKYVPPRKSAMCGNTICQDRRFLYRYMPELEDYFHYRNLDVSTVKELARYWAPSMLSSHKKSAKHRALDDIKESIIELQYYRDNFFKLEP